MTSKSLFFNLMKEDGKRRLWAIALTFLAYFFTLPVSVTMLFGTYDRIEQRERLINDLSGYITLENGFLVFLVLAFAVMFGVTGFSYLHSRKKMDFYHSIPVRREKLFAVNYLVGILIPAGAYLFNLLAALIIMSINGVGTGSLLMPALAAYGFYMLHYILIYSSIVLAMILTGNMVVGLLGAAVLNALVPCILGILAGLYSMFFVTSYYAELPFVEFWMDKLSPVALFITNYERFDTAELAASQMAVYLLGAAAMAAVMTFLALLLYKKRGSEAAGKAMAFEISRPVFRIPIVILSALAGGLFFWATNGNTEWAFFGLICGLLLSHCIIEIIFHFDFRKLFHARLSLLVCGCLSALIFCGFKYDFFGYDSYIPKKEEIEYVGISSYDLDSWVEYGQMKQNDRGEYQWEYEDRNKYGFDHMKLTDMDAVYPYMELAVANTKRKEDNQQDRVPISANGNGLMEEMGRWQNMNVKYTLKNGKEVYRSYSFYSEDAYQLLKGIYESPEYKQGTYPVLEQVPEDTTAIYVRRDNQSPQKTVEEQGKIAEFMEAYQTEFMNLTSETMEQEVPIGEMMFMTLPQEEAGKQDTLYTRNGRRNYYDIENTGYYPIYPSFTNTLALLKAEGIDLMKPIQAETVSRIKMDTYWFNPNPSDEINKENGELLIIDPTEIEAIVTQAMYGHYLNMNPFYITAGFVDVTIEFKNGRENDSYNLYYIERNDIPVSVMDKIAADSGTEPLTTN